MPTRAPMDSDYREDSIARVGMWAKAERLWHGLLTVATGRDRRSPVARNALGRPSVGAVARSGDRPQQLARMWAWHPARPIGSATMQVPSSAADCACSSPATTPRPCSNGGNCKPTPRPKAPRRQRHNGWLDRGPSQSRFERVRRRSSIGGVGINLAIQVAVATANILTRPLKEGRLSTRDLQKVQHRREFPPASRKPCKSSFKTAS
jgi:hypothetical protein